MFRRKNRDPQPAFWIPTQDVPLTPANSFYRRLDRELTKVGFGDAVRVLCEPFYETDATQGGRPGIDPEVYFKMLMIGFFENLSSERGIAARCYDSLSIRDFLHYALHEPTPDHSSLSVIRQRLDAEVFEKVFGLVLKALKESKLLNGRHLGIDASVLEANASLRSLKNRLTGDAYLEYVRKLAKAAGVGSDGCGSGSSFRQEAGGSQDEQRRVAESA